MISNPDGTGRPKQCSERVGWAGTTRLMNGRRIPVWSCDGHGGVDGRSGPLRLCRETIEKVARVGAGVRLWSAEGERGGRRCLTSRS